MSALCGTSGLPARGLGVDQAADDGHDARVAVMRAPEARGEDGPVLEPAEAVLDADAERPQCAVEPALVLGQLADARLLVRGPGGQVRALLHLTGRHVADRDVATREVRPC